MTPTRPGKSRPRPIRALSLAAIVCAVLPVVAIAQSGWTLRLNDTGGHAFATVAAPGYGISLYCHQRSRRRLPLVPLDEHEVSPMPPYSFALRIEPSLLSPDQGTVRSDLTIRLDAQQYRLPTVTYSDWDDGWILTLAMTDPFWGALQRATDIAVGAGGGPSLALPAAGLADGLSQAFAFCIDTSVATGHPVPPALAAFAPPGATPVPGSLPVPVKAHLDAYCESFATIEPSAITSADIDGDGAMDYAVNFRSVTCGADGTRYFCGAANCSILVYLSQKGFDDPAELLGGTVGLRPRGDAPGQEVVVGGSWSLCGETGLCPPVIWNGTDLVER